MKTGFLPTSDIAVGKGNRKRRRVAGQQEFGRRLEREATGNALAVHAIANSIST